MPEEKKQFQIYLPGLLKLLAESLYSSKTVAVRELIQNAHDSCVRRQAEHPNRHYRPRIDITFDTIERTLTITDNGSGLTGDEITEYLATIGRSYTQQLSENLAILSPDQAQQLIGQFGLGFLSAFLIASDVTLITRSAKPDSPSLRWQSEGDVHYKVTPIAEQPVGTQVTLTLKPEAMYLLRESRLRDEIHKYADFLDIPIHVHDSPTPINTMTPPWEATDQETAIFDYIKRHFGIIGPLYIIQLHDQVVDLGHDTVRVPLQGFLFVPPGTVASIQEYGDLTVFIKRMYICDRQRTLLPPWARFVRGVIDCPYLQPTASREEIQQETMFYHVQQALHQQLISALKDIARNQPDTWRLIVRGHRDLIMGWAVKDSRFFHDVAEIITFRTSHGELSLPEYTHKIGNKLYYITREMGSLQEKLLGEGYGVPVIDASRFSEPTFLRIYAEDHPELEMVQMDDDSYQLLHPADDDEYELLLDYFRQQGIRARISTFQPSAIPGILIYPPHAELFQDSRWAVDKGTLPRPFAGLVDDYISRLNVKDDELGGTLHLNATNSLIQALPNVDDPEIRNATLELIYHMARLFAGRMLETSDVADSFRLSTRAMRRLIGGES